MALTVSIPKNDQIWFFVFAGFGLLLGLLILTINSMVVSSRMKKKRKEIMANADRFLATEELTPQEYEIIRLHINTSTIYDLIKTLNKFVYANRQKARNKVAREQAKERRHTFEERVEKLYHDDKLLRQQKDFVFGKLESEGISSAQFALDFCLERKIGYDRLVEKYGEEKAENLFFERYFIGMTTEELKDASGLPTKIETAEDQSTFQETWVYGNKSSGDVFVFENGSLVRYKDR